MIEQNWDDETGTGHWSLLPNRSLSWQGNKRLLYVLSLPMLVLGSGLTWVGFWPVLPYVVVVFLALGVGLYFTALRLCRREVILLTEAEVIIQRGRHRVEYEVRLPRAWTQLVVHPGSNPSQAPRIALRSHGRETEFATELNADERGLCAASLRAAMAGGVFRAD